MDRMTKWTAVLGPDSGARQTRRVIAEMERNLCFAHTESATRIVNDVVRRAIELAERPPVGTIEYFLMEEDEQ